MEEAAIDIVPLTPDLFDSYIRIGIKSYCQHYLHLWENRDPDPYIENSFSSDIVQKEWEDPNVSLFLICSNTIPVGILKLILNKTFKLPEPVKCLFLERIYLLAEHSGRGIGARVLQFTEDIAKEQNTKAVCLETMQKGPALEFYQKNGYVIWSTKNLEYSGLVKAERPMFILGKHLN
ncbi:MAG: GNAT family N-acetyltransferase [Eudoraea sp.]|nr:GNAT family N-acetyltransferase [Eudoraea sp.]